MTSLAKVLAASGRLLAAGALLMLPLLAPQMARAQQAMPADVVAKGKSEGKLTVYTVSPDAEMQPLVNAFEKEYPGIKVEWIRLPSTTLLSRFTGELQSGVVQADVLISASSELFQQKPDLFRPVSAENLPNLGIPSQAKAANTAYAVTEIHYHVISYNTNLVSKDDIAKHLKSWKDLADPRWRGKIGMPNPKVTTNNVSWLKLMRDTYGDDWLRAFAKNDLTIVGTGSLAVQQMAVGSFEVTAPTLVAQTAGLVAQGAPIGTVMPEGPAHGLANAMALPKNSPHPNAALLFANWRLGVTAQTLPCDQGAIPVIPVPASSKCEPMSPHHVTALDLIPPETERQLLDLVGIKN